MREKGSDRLDRITNAEDATLRTVHFERPRRRENRPEYGRNQAVDNGGSFVCRAAGRNEAQQTEIPGGTAEKGALDDLAALGR